MKKRVLSILLALLMVMTIVPTAAFAAEGGESAQIADEATLIAALANGGVITLDGDIEVNQTMYITKDTFIVGNNKTLTRADGFTGEFFTVGRDAEKTTFNGVNFAVTAVTLDGGNTAAAVGELIDVDNLANVYVEDVTFQNNNGDANAGAVYVRDNCTFAASGCTFDKNTTPGTTASSSEGENGGAIYNHGANVYMNDCTLTNNTAYRGGAVYNTGGHLYVYDSEFTNNSTTNHAGAISFNSSANAEVYNSAFNENSAPNGNGGALWVYQGAGGTVTLNGCSFSGNRGKTGSAINVSNASVLNLYNTSVAPNTGTDDSFFYITTGDTTATILGLDAIGFDGIANKIIYSNSKSAIVNVDWSTCQKDGAQMGAATDVGYAAKKGLTVVEITGQAPAVPANPFVAVTVAPIADQTYTGEAIEPAVTVAFDGAAADAADYDVIYSNNTEAGTADVAVFAKNGAFGAATTSFTISAPAKNYAAQIGEAKYETLAEAIAAVPNDGTAATVKLLCDAVSCGIIVPSGTNMVVDLNGYTLTLDKPGVGSSGTTTNGFQLLKNSTIEFKNGTITIANENKDTTWSKTDTEKGIAILFQNYADLTLTDVNIDATNLAHNGGTTPRYALSVNNGETVFCGATNIDTATGDFAFDTYFNAAKPGSYTIPTVTFGDDFTGTINGNVELSGGELSIAAGTFNGDFVKSSGYIEGQAAISGGTFTADISEYCADGFAVIVDEDGNYIAATVSEAIEGLKDQIAELNKQIGNLEAATEDLNIAIEDLNDQKEELNDQITSLTTDKTALQTQVDTLTADKTALQTQIDTLTTEKTVLQSQVTDLTAQATALQTQVDTLTNEKGNLSAQIAELTAAKDQLTAQVADLTAKNTELQTKAENAAAQADDLTAQVADLQAQIEALKAENADAKDKADKAAADYEAQIAALKAENEQLKKANDDLTKENAQLKADNTALNDKVAKLESDAESLNAQVADLQTQMSAVNAQVADQNSEIQKLQAKNDLLANTIKLKKTVSGNKVTVSWNAIDGAKYKLTVKSASGTKTYTLSGTSKTFTVTRGKNYTYTVKAYKTVDGEKVYGNAKSVTVKVAPAKVARPTVTTPKTKTIKIAWNKTSGASYYQVSVSSSKTGTYYKTKKTTKRTFTVSKLTKGKTYYVKVRAVGANGVKGAWSTAKAVKVK